MLSEKEATPGMDRNLTLAASYMTLGVEREEENEQMDPWYEGLALGLRLAVINGLMRATGASMGRIVRDVDDRLREKIREQDRPDSVKRQALVILADWIETEPTP